MEKFFVSCELGFEEELREELEEVSGFFVGGDSRPLPEFPQDWHRVKGGWEFSASLFWGLQINYWSRIASRLWLRGPQFKARSFSELKSHWSKLVFPWDDGRELCLQVHSTQSKLFHEAAIQRELGSQKMAPQIVSLRIERDQVQVSFDTSGEHLHRRGLNKIVGSAPLRETRAAWAVHLLQKNLPPAENIHWVDPCVGSGTLLSELAHWNQPLERSFSFQNWRLCPKILRQRPPHFWGSKQFHQGLTGIDLDTSFIEASGVEQLGVRILRGDCRQIPRESLGIPLGNEEEVLLCCFTNPPYGERISDQELRLEELAQLLLGWNVGYWGLFYPSSRRDRVKALLKWKVEICRSFSNGGLATDFYLLRLSEGPSGDLGDEALFPEALSHSKPS